MSANVQIELRVDMTADIVDDRKGLQRARTKAEHTWYMALVMLESMKSTLRWS